MEMDAKIYIAGHRGLVGDAIVQSLKKGGWNNLLLRNHAELDLSDKRQVDDFFAWEKPEYVFLAAAKVGGIHANNTYPVDFIVDNLAIELNVISAAHAHGVKRLMFLGSSCIYPKRCPQPMREEYLLTGSLEPTNEPYAVAKIAGIKMCEAYNRQYGTDYVSVMPTNLYGPNDNFDLQNSHVLPALIRKFHEAREQDRDKVIIWGTGNPRREFLYVDDMADACVYVMNRDGFTDMVNIGVGDDITIAGLAKLVGDVIGFEGALEFDTEKPDGTPQKLLDVSRLTSLGWQAKTSLKKGIQLTYKWFLDNQETLRT
ncbi:MAG: GDP-L-fucose synthase [Candidatus Thiodiazotropha endolucinida]|uniref:GDP-L-fucose synthase n=1 Tax=Candidatus Thiodiazotropha taylori TaxID=2792791 RepID=A0A9E4NGT6_9GAMM|nr:GDP-L-fucose synthase [Candidatus Thiodiazotropha sp. (ex Codakia orbicularis)]MCG7976926.1 GDP-L-fucose synthase [Candidatus Thiodiazotropha taylori]MCW4235046.1 GDP-L-fucose synthase [Candidatus Thiodiazotropha endolucinida]